MSWAETDRLHAADNAPFRVGAAKVDITPPERVLPYAQTGGGVLDGSRAFVAVHDPLYARAVVVESGSEMAAFVTVDLEKVPHAAEFERRLVEASGIPAERILLAATHNHTECSGACWRRSNGLCALLIQGCASQCRDY